MCLFVIVIALGLISLGARDGFWFVGLRLVRGVTCTFICFECSFEYMVYKQTLAGVVRITQRTLFLFISLAVVFQLFSIIGSPELVPVDGHIFLWLIGGCIFVWFILLGFYGVNEFPILASDYISPDIRSLYTEGSSQFDKLYSYSSGHSYTRSYLLMEIYSTVVTLVVFSSVLSLMYYIGHMYLFSVLVTYIVVPLVVYAFDVSEDVSGLESLDEEDINVGVLRSLIGELQDFFGVEDVKVHIADSKSNDLYMAKSVFGESMLVCSPNTIEDIASDDPDLDMADRFKLAHEFAHLSIGSKYIVYFKLCLIALSFVYYIVVTSFVSSLAIVALISGVFMLTVRLVSRYFQRIEEYRADELASKFIGADSEDCVFALVRIAGDKNNPFTFPSKSVLGRVYTMFSSHPPIVSRIRKLVDELNED